MNRLIILFLLAGFPAFCLAQPTSTVKGRLLSGADSMAVVGARVATAPAVVNATSAADGTFTLTGVPNTATSVTVSVMGFDPLEIAVELTGGTVALGVIMMDEAANEIAPVVVTGTPPIVVTKTDTMEFRAAAYKTNPDADADQLIMKMPGVVIHSGRVEAQGEPVRRIYVDGKLFFGTDPMAALKNIPADAVESIQIFDEQSEMARLTGFEDGETRKAINIVTKTKEKTTQLFKSEVSGGADLDADRRLGASRFLAGGNYSHFDGKQRITLTAMGNNVNTKRFGENDMADESEVDENGNLKNQPSGISRLFGLGANYSYESKKVKFSGSYFYDRNQNRTVEDRFLSYSPDPKGNYTERHTFNSPDLHSTQHNQRFNARLEWRPGEGNTIVFTPRVSFQKTDSRDVWEGLTLQDRPNAKPPLPFDSTNRNITEYPLNNRLSTSFSGGLYMTHRFAAKRGRSLSLSVSYSINLRDNESLTIDRLRQEYKNGGWNNVRPQSFTDRRTDLFSDNNNISFRVSYAEPFLQYHRLQFTLIAKRDWGGNEKTTYNNVHRGRDTIPDYSEPNKSQNEHFIRNYNTYGGGIGYAFYQKKLTLNSGVDFQHIRQLRETYVPSETVTNLSFFDMQPWLSMKYSIQKKSYLRVQYRGKTVLPRIDQMHNTINDASLSHLRQGNPDLKEGYEHSLIAFYNRSNTAKSRNVTFTLDARTRSNFAAPETRVLGDDEKIYNPVTGEEIAFQKNAFLTRFVNLNGYAAVRSSATFSQAIKPIRSNLNLSLAYNFIRTPSMFGNTEGLTLNYANLHSGGVRVGLTSNISEKIDFNFYSNTAFNLTQNSSKDNTSFLNQNLYYSLNVIFPLDFVFNTLVTWRYFDSSSTDQTNSFWEVNAGVGKKFFRNRNGELRLTVYDMLNQSRNILHFVRDNYVEDRETNTLQRYVLLRFSYRFNSLTHGRKKPATIPGGTNFQEIDLKDLKKMSNLQQKKRQNPSVNP